MADETFPNSNIPVRKSAELLPNVFRTEANEKFLAGTLDALVQPGKLDKTIGYVGRRYGKTYKSSDVYLDDDETLRSRYQLEPAVVIKKNNEIKNFYDYIDFKNQLKFFGNDIDRDDLISFQETYTWDPPIEWDKFLNFREYYWVPEGPPPVKIIGQSQEIVSTYRVRLGVGSVFVFTPDGFKNNPTITLYRGQTYKFNINAPDNGFVIRTNYDTGSLSYNPTKSYSVGEYAIFAGKLWQAKTTIPFSEGSTINEESEDWQYIEDATQPRSFDYNQGIINNGTLQGTLTFEVPLDAPDVLFYQSNTDPNRFGRFIIADIEENTSIDVEAEILGKSTYTSGNSVAFTNGMIVYFIGNITPEKYTKDTWVVEGVGSEIQLIRFKDLSIPQITTNIPEVLFDNSGFDTEPFDDATSYPGTKDYITINRASRDSNPWSRYNRWFHGSVLRLAHEFNGTNFDSNSESRAKRPIIEFKSNLQLIDHGVNAKVPVDFIDTTTRDVFSEIEGSQGYYVDGEELFQGARVLFTADTDALANNKIYEVNFIEHSTGSAFRNDWSVLNTYRNGETVRYLGQSFTSRTTLPSYSATVISSINSSNRYRIAKNPNIRIDQAITFSGGVFGGVLVDVLYFVREVFNTDPSSTEFTISPTKRGNYINLSTSAAGLQSMIARFSEHPTNIDYWNISRDKRQISLKTVSDTVSIVNECVLVKRGAANRQLMYHYDGESWTLSQKKTSVNQSPRFDVFDDDGISFADLTSYPVSDFQGSEILSYKIGNSVTDPELAFPLSYLNIDNIGDILFEFDWEKEIFHYEIAGGEISKKISSGYYKFSNNGNIGNSWSKLDDEFYQPIIYSAVVQNESNTIALDPVKWADVNESDIKKILLYVNGEIYKGAVTRTNNKFSFEVNLERGDTVTIKLFVSSVPSNGYYEFPISVEKNPLNASLIEFTLGQVTDHIANAIDLYDDFAGSFPGDSNLRDLAGYEKYARRFLKHSGSAPISLSLLCDKNINIIKSLEFAAKAYRDFKNNFLQIASQLDYDQNPVNFVDTVISDINRSKSERDAFLDSDMLGVGAYTSINYVVEDEGIKTFALSEKFDLKTPSRKAVYVYYNGQQLLNGLHYKFNSNFGFVELIINLSEGDEIEIREYTSTVYCYIPPTPTKLGLYKKYLPQKFIDDTYNVPVLVIQGHDGSITVAYNDYRDDVLLEFETRIYNNIKIEYDKDIFDIDGVFGNKDNAVYSKNEVDSIIDRQFRKWAVQQRVDSVTNSFYINQEPFTYNYSEMLGPNDTNLPGYWRGIYRYFYDTDRPHRCPWEMLGFSEKPDWWEDQYGSAPYTSNNLLLWEDLRDGIIRQGIHQGTYDRYKRSTILDHIPVDGDGHLLDPISSNLISLLKIESANKGFMFGDIAPAEYSWRISSEFPFTVIIASCLLRPFEYVSKMLDRLTIKKNKLDQIVSIASNYFFVLDDIQLSQIGGKISSGLINFLVDYQKYLGSDPSLVLENLSSIDVNLSTRLSGFVDKQQQRYILDSKNPNSSSSSVFIPQENYNIIFNVSSPIRTLSYSGIIVSKTDRGLQVFGYDNLEPVFKYYSVFPNNTDPVISVGGVSENFLEWEPNTLFNNGTIVRSGQNFYKALRTHTSTDEFEIDKWQRIAKLPLVGAAEALKRTKFNKAVVRNISYGTIFNNIQNLVDFICGYEEFLKDQGFIFDQYDQDLAVPRNWTTSIKELLFWSKHNWSVGSLISLSPAANKITINIEIGVLENLLDSFFEYSIFQSDGNLISAEQINVNRQFRKVEIDTVSQNQGIYLFRGYLILKEHVTVFSDRTVFNDVIYDKPAGYRQDRIKSRGFRTVDWDGDYTSPGFIFDNVDIKAWQPFSDYNLGDIVAYKSYYYTSLQLQRGLDRFDNSKWTRLDLVPEKQLIANFDFKANQFSDFYDLDSDGAGQSQRDLARHALAYQKRDYLQAMAEDDVTQFKLYQGFIREKGTLNSIEKVFSKLSSNRGGITVNEEWAFRLGNLGGNDQVYETEFKIEKSNLVINPQPLIVVSGVIEENTVTDQYYRINQKDFLVSTIPFSKNKNPVSKYSGLSRSAGYVKSSDVQYIVKDRNDLLSLDINSIPVNSHIWITFDNSTWNVVRFEYDRTFIIRDIQGPSEIAVRSLDSNSDETFTIISLILNRRVFLSRNDVIGIRDIKDLTGFYPVLQVRSNVVDIIVSSAQKQIDFESSTISYNLYFLKPARFSRYSDLNVEEASLLPVSSKLWIDDGYSEIDSWQTIEKNQRFSVLAVRNYLITSPTRIGAAVAYSEQLKQSFFSITGNGYVAAAVESGNNLLIKQLIAPITDVEDFVNHSFGESIAVSPDGKWLAVGSPRAAGAPSNFAGIFNPSSSYFAGDIVLYQGRLWEATASFAGDSSGFVLDSDKPNWKIANVILLNLEGNYLGPTNHGMVSLYKYVSGQWTADAVILSPRIDTNELFGSEIKLAVSGNRYFLIVSAKGSNNNLGRVYIFVYSNNEWKILQDQNYKGVYTGQEETYPAGSIVWFENALYRTTEDYTGDGSSTLNLESGAWEKIELVNIETALPQRISYEADDGSTTTTGLFEDSTIGGFTLAEVIKIGDQFGHSLAVNRDASILAVGVPLGDNEYFSNYKGDWRPYQEYRTGDVVRYHDAVSGITSYRRLFDPRSDEDPQTDSTQIYISVNESPAGDPWESVGDSSSLPVGKVFIYQRKLNDVYVLAQTIAADNLESLSDIANQNLASGDQFGYSIDIDSSGYSLVVSSPYTDINFTSQGSVYVFRTTSLETIEFRLKQKLQSFERYPNEQFGSSVSISGRSERLAVGARNSKFKFVLTFDQANTTFDDGKTSYSEDRGNSGQVYVFEKKDETYFLVEKLEDDLQDFESFGERLDISADFVLVSSPKFLELAIAGSFVPGETYTIKNPGNTDWYAIGLPTGTKAVYGSRFTASGVGIGSGTAFSQTEVGKIRLFKKQPDVDSWTITSEEADLVDLEKIVNVQLNDRDNDVKITDIDFIDHYKLKVLGNAEQELKFKTVYDPAIYSIGTGDHEVDKKQSWYEEHVGQLWWDLSTAKFYYFEQGDISYRISQANKQIPYSSIDIYEWVESKFLPSQWAALADTNEGISLGISGMPKYPDNTVYSVKELYNSSSGALTETKYYFWVKNSSVLPRDVPGRRISAVEVRNLINNPEGSGVPYITFVDEDKFLLYNFETSVSSESASLNVQYNKGYNLLNPIHKEFLLLTEGISDSLPNYQLEAKWIDSLVGYDISGNKVPDETLSNFQKYGISFRPRQTMFQDRFEVLDAVLTNINTLLLSRPFADVIDFKTLNLFDPIPSQILNEYDVVVENAIDLQNVGTVRIRRAILIANIVNGRIDTITIRDSGFGYKVVPLITIVGDGEDAEATVEIDNFGRVVGVSITNQGKNYTSAVISIRNFSVLVNTDETIKNYWSIYAWDDQRRVFTRSKIQSFDTRQYWRYNDWYEDDYGVTTKINLEIFNLYQESTISPQIGDVIKVKEFGNGGWALLELSGDNQADILGKYRLIGRQSGTIQIIKEEFLPNNRIGFDTSLTYDSDVFDIQPTRELRNILLTCKEDIFTESLRVEWNKLFFDSIRHAFIQSPNVDWAFKTSFLTAKHTIGDLEKKNSYKNDNIESFQSYLEEIKPYRTSIREYITQYNNLDDSLHPITDFDSPPAFSIADGRIMPVNRDYDRFDEYPWKWFKDNQGYEIVGIEIYSSGSGYVYPPSVLIEGDGTGCQARAYISNGSVSRIQIVTPGKGYTFAPMISLVGGNGTSDDIAKASAILGNGLIRSLRTTLRFDRLAKTRNQNSFVQSESFTAGGFTAAFDLKYAPMIDKNRIVVYKNSQLVLSDQYAITLYRIDSNNNGTLRGKIIFQQIPSAGDLIELEYEKNNDYLDALSRIEKYYFPQTGMLGKDPGQLMTGIDFGGVQIQGTTFDVTGGWDALPWFTDNWDSVESSSDYYYIADGSTIYVDLPFVPALGENISIYLQKNSITAARNIDTLNDPTVDPVYVINSQIVASRPVRIDDPNYNDEWDSSVQRDSSVLVNPSAQMPTFIGDGVSKRVEFVNPTTDIPYIQIEAGDTLIFRRDDSDGSVAINDVNIIDTRISGGSLSAMEGAYVTATGRTTEEIVVDGDRFISPDQVTAPEENIPGQILEGLSIKVFHTIVQGAAAVQNAVYIADGINRLFDIKLRVMESKSILVYVNKLKVDDSSNVYEIDYVTNRVVFAVAPIETSIIEIISIGVGGVNLLDYQEFVGEGDTDLFLTQAEFEDTVSVFVTLDGEQVDAVFLDSGEFTDRAGRTIVQLGTTPLIGQVLKIICLGASLDTDSLGQSLIRLNSQTIYYDGSTVRLELDRFVNLTRAAATSSVIVEVNGQALLGADTVRAVYDGTNNSIEIGKDPFRVSGLIGLNDFEVYINNEPQPVITAYTFNAFTKVVTINPALLSVDDEIKILTIRDTDYTVVGNDLVISEDRAAAMNVGDRIDVTWFSEYPSFDIISDEYTGGQFSYLLKRNPLSDSYVWVYKNGVRLTLNEDYSLELLTRSVKLAQQTVNTDKIKIIEFGNKLWNLPHAYEIHKDMLNLTYYKRFSQRDITLASDLTYYATEIVLNDASSLFEPRPELNQPGTIYINEEKIEYFAKIGNTLKQLRRGVHGTAIGESYAAETPVVDMSKLETIPYRDTQDRYDFVSDGSTLLIGPLDFTPVKGQRNTWFRNTIPDIYGPCDEFEVFAGGKRLRKDPISQFNENLGSVSPEADETLEAEFSVDGVNAYIRLTDPLPAGTRVNIIKRRGKTWYDRGSNTAHNGKTMTESTNAIVRFILQKETYLPE